MTEEHLPYTSKLKFHLDPEMRADEATRVILRFLCGVMRHNEQGIREDRDVEHLHDYRVAVRRTRSALGQIRSVFSDEATQHYKEHFAIVGRWTNDLRDMDVYLSAEETYRVMLPEALRDDIDPLFDLLRQKRSEAHAMVVEGLDSDSYAELMSDWEAFLSEPPTNDPTAVNGALPIVDLACARIYKRYRRVVKTGRRLLEGATDDELHALRVECKKLRYLMEFFASLFPRKKIRYLIKQLKRLQRNLGDFNDYRIQQAYLFGIANEWLPDDFGEALLAVGSLIGTLEVGKARERTVFDRTFIEFASADNEALFQKLFKVRRNEAGPR